MSGIMGPAIDVRQWFFSATSATLTLGQSCHVRRSWLPILVRVVLLSPETLLAGESSEAAAVAAAVRRGYSDPGPRHSRAHPFRLIFTSYPLQAGVAVEGMKVA